jgi:hypothetical protein
MFGIYYGLITLLSPAVDLGPVYINFAMICFHGPLYYYWVFATNPDLSEELEGRRAILERIGITLVPWATMFMALSPSPPWMVYTSWAI